MLAKKFSIAITGLLTIGVLAGCSASATGTTTSSSHETTKTVSKKSPKQTATKNKAVAVAVNTTTVNATQTAGSQQNVKQQIVSQPESNYSANSAVVTSNTSVQTQPKADTASSVAPSQTVAQTAQSTTNQSSTRTVQLAQQQNASTESNQQSAVGPTIVNSSSLSGAVNGTSANANSTQTSTTGQALTPAQQQALILMNSGKPTAGVDWTGVAQVNSPWKISQPDATNQNQVTVFNTAGGITPVGYTIAGDSVNVYQVPSAGDQNFVLSPEKTFSLANATSQAQGNAADWTQVQTLATQFK